MMVEYPAYMTCKHAEIVQDVPNTTHLCFKDMTGKEENWLKALDNVHMEDASEDNCIEKCPDWEVEG